MILTHSLTMIWGPALALTPQTGALVIGDGGALVTIGQTLVLIPALPVRAEPVLKVRGD